MINKKEKKIILVTLLFGHHYTSRRYCINYIHRPLFASFSVCVQHRKDYRAIGHQVKQIHQFNGVTDLHRGRIAVAIPIPGISTTLTSFSYSLHFGILFFLLHSHRNYKSSGSFARPVKNHLSFPAVGSGAVILKRYHYSTSISCFFFFVFAFSFGTCSLIDYLFN